MRGGELYKVEGAGNDFLLGTGAWADRLASDPALVRRLCRRRLGLGADGTLAVFAEEGSAVRVVYRNSDGGEAAFCANGARCAARAGVQLLEKPAELVVRTAWQDIPAEVHGSLVTLDLPAPPAAPERLQLETAGRQWEAWAVEVGVPHLVVPVAGDLGELEVERWGPLLRAHPDLGPEGANVSFVAATPGGAAVRSWERGVEAETLSCGSGVVATALVWMAGHDLGTLTCSTRSGQALTVDALGTPPLCRARLTGPAHFLARITATEELEGE